MTNNLLSELDAASYLGCTQRALAYWRKKGTGPSYLRLSSKQIRYRKSDLEAWLAELASDGTAASLDGLPLTKKTERTL